MNRPSNSYWEKRFELLTESLLNKADKHYMELIQEYEKALLRIQREIERFYAKFAIDNQITLQEARKLLNSRELKEFHWTIEEYIEKAIESSLDERWIKELNNVSARVRISRLESLEYQIRQQIELLYAKRQEGLTELAKEITEEGYYRTIYEIQKGFGVGDTFGLLDTRLIESIITRPWAPDGSNFSSRIWRDKNLLMSELQKVLTQSFIRGDAPDKAIRHIAKTMNVSKRAAGRLVMTESAFFANNARERAFRELGVEEYQFIATLDTRTSEICQDMDLKVFKLSEKQVGVNWPPLHPNCRSTTAPYFEGNIKERWARDPVTGKGYRVENMSYKEWYEKYVSNNSEAILAEKKWKNRHTDKR